MSKRKGEEHPVAPARQRLDDARTYWFRALAAYCDPDEFRLMLNGCIQALRSVTFMLQKQKARISGFEEWYCGGVRSRLSADVIASWLADARNHIEKKGDLQKSSTARLQVIDSYLESIVFETEVDPFIDAELRRRKTEAKGKS